MEFTLFYNSYNKFLLCFVLFSCPMKLFAGQAETTIGADIIIFSYDNPMHLYALLESIEENMTGVNSTQVIYKASDDRSESAYENVRHRFSKPNYRRFLTTLSEFEFKRHVISSMVGTKGKYIMFAVDGVLVKDQINLFDCCDLLEKNDAYGFYLRLGKNIKSSGALNCLQPLPNFISNADKIYAWHYNDAICDWGCIFNCEMTIYKKEDILRFVVGYNYGSPDELITCFNYNYEDLSYKKALCFEKSCVVTIIRNIAFAEAYRSRLPYVSNQELIEKFQAGFKFDLTKIDQSATSCQIEYIPCYTLQNLT